MASEVSVFFPSVYSERTPSRNESPYRVPTSTWREFYSGVLRGLKAIPPLSRSIQVVLMKGNDLTDYSPLASCAHLRYVDLSFNKIRHFCVLPQAEILLLDHNFISDYRPDSGLRILTLACNPVAEMQGYRACVVNSSSSLKFLDDYPVADEELVQDADFSGTRFASPSSGRNTRWNSDPVPDFYRRGHHNVANLLRVANRLSDLLSPARAIQQFLRRFARQTHICTRIQALARGFGVRIKARRAFRFVLLFPRRDDAAAAIQLAFRRFYNEVVLLKSTSLLQRWYRRTLLRELPQDDDDDNSIVRVEPVIVEVEESSYSDTSEYSQQSRSSTATAAEEDALSSTDRQRALEAHLSRGDAVEQVRVRRPLTRHISRKAVEKRPRPPAGSSIRSVIRRAEAPHRSRCDFKAIWRERQTREREVSREAVEKQKILHRRAREHVADAKERKMMEARRGVEKDRMQLKLYEASRSSTVRRKLPRTAKKKIDEEGLLVALRLSQHAGLLQRLSVQRRRFALN